MNACALAIDHDAAREDRPTMQGTRGTRLES